MPDPDHVPASRGAATGRGTARCAAAAALFGISTPAAALIVGDMGPFTLAGLLYIGAALAVAPFAVRQRPTLVDVRASFPKLTVAVIAGGLIGPLLLALGLALVPAATASLLLNLELVFTVILAAVIFREHLGSRVIAGTIIVCSGSILLTWTGNPSATWGAILIAAACASWALDKRPLHLETVGYCASRPVSLVQTTLRGRGERPQNGPKLIV